MTRKFWNKPVVRMSEGWLRTGGILMAIVIAGAIFDLAPVSRAWAASDETATTRKSITIPAVDARRGRRLFVSRGCVICHAVRGVGGTAAPALDADPSSRSIDLMGFVARMWQGAPAMLELQAVELGYQILLTSQEMADLAAFSGDAAAQDGFSAEEVPEPMRDWMLDEPYWENEGWPDDLPEEFPEMDDDTNL